LVLASLKPRCKQWWVSQQAITPHNASDENYPAFLSHCSDFTRGTSLSIKGKMKIFEMINSRKFNLTNSFCVFLCPCGWILSVLQVKHLQLWFMSDSVCYFPLISHLTVLIQVWFGLVSWQETEIYARRPSLEIAWPQ
jgi:hypothetical protein